ncbi:hypothetical protein D9757_012138 [Collybiopsis confluens]|uniref:Nephrocystin 3-like N-terminal domain-containing protein n=1 Tax=Collybiopsis confluens TaxID=2823264 RepID=A0A8H5GI30_9AGAR|nr:hypothetical protein D9757_012138 [Collybiopsis confluens]
MFNESSNFCKGNEASLFALLQATSPAAAYDAGARYPPPLCHPGTRKAVLRDLDGWADRSTDNHSSIQWLYGPAGAGKSAIAQTFAQSCAENSMLIGSYFFWRSDSTRNNPQRLFTTIALQMAISIPELRPLINIAVLEDPLAITSSIEKQADALIIRPWLKSLINQVDSIRRERRRACVFIIDGLDECADSHDQESLLSILASIIHRCGDSIRILVCSRPEPRIKESFLGPELSDICRWMCLGDTFEASNDIRRFLVDGFRRILTRHSLSMQDILRPWPTSQQIEYLVQKSSGQFIYASTVLSYLDEDGDVPAERLKVVVGLSIDDYAGRDAPFAELDALYHQILSTVKNQASMLRVLAARMVFNDESTSSTDSSRQFIQLLNIPLGSLHATFSSLHSLFKDPSPVESGFKFCHASFPDFLLDRRRSLHFHIKITSGHEYLAQCCLKQYNITQVPVALPDSTVYSRRNWCYHSLRARGTSIERTCDPVPILSTLCCALPPNCTVRRGLAVAACVPLSRGIGALGY